MTYRAILFDLDDTLYDLRSYWRRRLHKAIHELLPPYPHFDRDALFVGDSPEFDLRGAAAAGMPFIWMNPRGEQMPSDVAQPIAVIERLTELLPLLDGRSMVDKLTS